MLVLAGYAREDAGQTGPNFGGDAAAGRSRRVGRCEEAACTGGKDIGLLVCAHYCGGSASGVFGEAQGGGIVSAADQYGFIMIFPQTTNPATSANCWDVGSTKSLTHDRGGDTQAVAQMVKYTITKYQANANRVYATGTSSAAMMTEALLAVYPDVFKAGAEFSGVPARAALAWHGGLHHQLH
jgi:poly(hydroxyalkanoate) depolymerase family esterase